MPSKLLAALTLLTLAPGKPEYTKTVGVTVPPQAGRTYVHVVDVPDSVTQVRVEIAVAYLSEKL